MYLTKNKLLLNQNLEPLEMSLYQVLPDIEKMAKGMVDAFGTQHYIANLGHGILPNITVDHAIAFVNAIKSYSL